MTVFKTLACAFVVAAATASMPARSADYPSGRPIRMIIPSAPGGGTDFIGRTLSQKIADATGWSIVADNRAGASGTLGLAELARARPDGHDLAIGQAANVSLAPWLMKLNFDPVKDLMPIALAVEAPMVLTVPADSPFKTWDDFVKAAKAQPSNPPSFATSGNGSVAQIAGEKLQEASNFKMQHLAYKGSAPALADLAGGHVHLAGTSVTSALSLLQSGKVRALVVTSEKRSAALPDVPALAELGHPKFHYVEWYGVFAPAGTPAAIADRLHAEVNKALQRSEVRSAIQAQGQEPRTESRETFAAMVAEDSRAAKAIIEKAGIKLE